MSGSNQINIAVESVEQYSGQLKQIQGQMQSELDGVIQGMQGLHSTWQGEASDALAAKVAGIRPKIDQYLQAVQAYSDFLRNAAQEMRQTEGAVQSEVNGLS
jgi:WXG100 family type VII secretion target